MVIFRKNVELLTHPRPASKSVIQRRENVTKHAYTVCCVDTGPSRDILQKQLSTASESKDDAVC